MYGGVQGAAPLGDVDGPPFHDPPGGTDRRAPRPIPPSELLTRGDAPMQIFRFRPRVPVGTRWDLRASVREAYQLALPILVESDITDASQRIGSNDRNPGHSFHNVHYRTPDSSVGVNPSTPTRLNPLVRWGMAIGSVLHAMVTGLDPSDYLTPQQRRKLRFGEWAR